MNFSILNLEKSLKCKRIFTCLELIFIIHFEIERTFFSSYIFIQFILFLVEGIP